MTKQYNVEEFNGIQVIWYEENGFRYSFGANESNPDYREYLATLASESQAPAAPTA